MRLLYLTTMSGTPDTRLVADGPALALGGLPHRVHEPENPGPRRALVMLHGRRGDENVMWVLARTVPAGWLLVAPRGPRPDPEGGYAWHPRKRDEWPPLETFDAAVAAVVKLIRALPDLYDADPNHFYLMGFSQGAATAYATALRHPGLVKGIAGLVGFMPVVGDEVLNRKPLAGLPVFMSVGQRDPLIPLTVAEACAHNLRAAGAALEYHAYDTVHKVDVKGMQALKRWWGERDAER
jgi:phospholipase/carboxylesterase